jgi:hypothetical protein
MKRLALVLVLAVAFSIVPLGHRWTDGHRWSAPTTASAPIPNGHRW